MLSPKLLTLFVSAGLTLSSVGAIADQPATPAPSAPAASPSTMPAVSPSSVPALSASNGQEIFEVFPAKIRLDTSRAEQMVVAHVVEPNGVTQDVTSQLQYTLPNPNIVRTQANVFYPVADGTGELQVKFHDHLATIPVEVQHATQDRPISFRLDVMPVFLRAGCNTGACHGSARGKDGFHLSLFGYDPDGDYDRITREQATRRINLALPAESLLLTKAIGGVPHTGGTRFKSDSPLYATVMRWLDAGAPKDPPAVAAPTSIEILPHQAVLEGAGASQQFTVLAHYSDGTDRDVTHLALFLSNNDNSAKIDENGNVTAASRGEAFVMARFNTFTVGSQVLVIPKDDSFSFPTVSENNFIDTLVDNKLKKMRMLPSDLCTDEVYLRRAYVDVIGMLPTREEHDRFMANTDPQKRNKLIDELLGRKEFVELWVMKWAELLQIRSGGERQLSYKSTLLFYNWLQERLANNVPMDKIVQELLGANGGTFKNPATNYYQITAENLKLAENTAQVFMGMRIQCSQCHNHPFDRWTMNDYYGFAAFFSQVGRKQAEDPRESIIFNSGGGEVTHPVGGRVMAPKFLGGETPDVKGKDRRVVLAEWIASPQNPYFAKNLANIVWSHFLGKGIIDPVDDVRVSNPAVNPELLDALGQKFQEYHYDFRRLVKDICASRTYQLASETNATNEQDTRNFSHAAIRRMRAEVALDALSEVTEMQEKFRGLPGGARAVQIADGETSNYFLTTFGRATRETVCSCEVKMDPNLSQALSLLNGDTVERKLQNSPVLQRLMESKASPEQAITDLYVRCFARAPLPAEMQALTAAYNQEPDHRKALEDIFWALLNSQEFMFNH
jgi:hypothetical protein